MMLRIELPVAELPVWRWHRLQKSVASRNCLHVQGYTYAAKRQLRVTKLNGRCWPPPA